MEGCRLVHAALLQLSNPRLPDEHPLAGNLSLDQWTDLFTLASFHGVLGIILHNLKSHATVPQELLQLAHRRWRAEWAVSLRLRQLGRQLLDAMAALQVPAAIFKGTDFADHLYPLPTLRPARDIDLLVPQEHWPAAEAVLSQLGYERQPELSKRHEATDYGERCWRLRADNAISAELHWNLIRTPSLRQRASIGLDDLNRVSTDPESGGSALFTPASRLIIAAVHATFIHQFDRLLLLCDIREAARQVATEADVAELGALSRKTKTTTALNAALGVTARLLNNPGAAALRRRLGGRENGSFGLCLVSENMVLYPPRRLSSLRRVFIREWLKRAA
jgi:hypothetical protein